MAEVPDLIIVGFVCFSLGVLTGVSLSFVFTYMTKMVESAQPSYIEVETDEKGAIKQVVTRQ